MTGSIFKRKLRTGVSWGYIFFGGWDENGKRIQMFKSGFPTKDGVPGRTRCNRAVRSHQQARSPEKVMRADSLYGPSRYLGDGEHESGFETKAKAELALQKALARSDVEKAKRADDAAESAGPLFAQHFKHWLKEHASRRCAPKTLERYGEIGAYLIRELGEVRLNEMTTAEIQEAIHHLQDHGGRRTSAEPQGRPLAPKTVRHMGTLLFTVLSDAERLGVLKIPNPMANRRSAAAKADQT